LQPISLNLKRFFSWGKFKADVMLSSWHAYIFAKNLARYAYKKTVLQSCS